MLLTVVLYACSSDPQPHRSTGTYTVVILEAVGDDSLAAAQVSLAYDPRRLELAGVGSTQENASIMARHGSPASGVVKIALVTNTEVSGNLVKVAFVERTAPEGMNDMQILDARAYRGDESIAGAAIGIASVRRQEVENPTQGYDPTSLELATTIEMQGVTQPADLALQIGFADYTLGDLTRSGELGVLDVLRILNIAIGEREPKSGYEWYHADMNSDGSIDVLDVIKALDKAVDPNLPGRLQVAPRLHTFQQVHLDRVPILVGNAGRQPLSTISIALEPSAHWTVDAVEGAGVPGHSAAYQVEVLPGWRNGVASFRDGSGEGRDVLVGNLTLLIAGQSNATGYGELGSEDEQGVPNVHMLRNDFRWLQAYEPIHDNVGQVECESYQDQTPEGCDVGYHANPGHSFAVRLGNDLHEVSGRDVYLIPVAKNGSALRSSSNHHGEWWPPSSTERLERSTLFGNANFRAQLSAGWLPDLKPGTPPLGGPVSAIIWYQGESEASRGLSGTTFVSRTNAVMDALAQELHSPPVVFVQLGRSSTAYGGHQYMQRIREYQRRMEAGYGTMPRSDFFMVVAHDLPLVDRIHLSAEGQRMLGERIALAYREHVLGEDVNGTGPRLQSISWDPASDDGIQVQLDRPVGASTTNYSGYFYVREGSDDTNIVESAQRIADRVIRLTLSHSPSEQVTLSYEPPFVDESGSGFLADVVRDEDGLPLPAFGPLPVSATQ